MRKSLSRRTLLRGLGGALISLPFLEAMADESPTENVSIPSRMGVFYFGTGMNIPDFLPKQSGSKFTATPILKPLEKFRSAMTVVSGTYLEHGGGHGGDYTFLTGAPGKRTDGTIENSISADQIAARHIGEATRFSSLQLSIARGTGLGGNLSTLSWNENGIPLPAENDPHVFFQRLFGTEATRDRQARERSLRRRASILDQTSAQAKKLSAQISSRDRETFEQYLDSVREVEAQLGRSAEWFNKPKPLPNVQGMGDFEKSYAPNSAEWNYETYAHLMYDLVALALQTDSTRVVTYVVRQESRGGVFPEFGVSKDYHALTHHNNNPRDLAELTKVDTIYMRHWAYFLERLHSMKEPDGSSVLDHSLLAYSSGMGTNHSRDKLPTALFSGQALGVSHQGHLKLATNTPLAVVWHTMLDRLQVPIEGQFQDSPGVIRELVGS